MKKKIKYYIFNKPYNVLSQFTRESGSESIADYFFIDIKDVYPIGRLDKDSEGLLILTNDKSMNALILSPKQNKSKTYMAQVEGVFSREASKRLKEGIPITVDKKVHQTLPAHAKKVEKPKYLWDRNPPVRFRKDIPTSWVELTLNEGKNRQVRKMLAAVGFPVLRLIRMSIEKLDLDQIAPGDIQEYNRQDFFKKLGIREV
ncbi:MAG: 23S rRNA pseudouridine2457 synthase [Chitinophagales bacterium]|jgi:23S rRNA pseudouridine2457 synthase